MGLSALLEPLVLGPYEQRQIELMVSWLPEWMRDLLAKGPITGEHRRGHCCRVCVATRPIRDDPEFWGETRSARRPPSRKTVRLSNVIGSLMQWHQGDDLARWGIEPGAGDIVYERCLMIYRAAGWVELPEDLRELPGERLFARLPVSTRPRDIVTLSDGQRAVVETAHAADDLKDAKCTVITL